MTSDNETGTARNGDDLRPGLVRDPEESCTTCGNYRAEHDAVKWPHTWLPRRIVWESRDNRPVP